jgi:allophanate hydrolase subunit 1
MNRVKDQLSCELSSHREYIMASKTLQIQNVVNDSNTSRIILMLFSIDGVNSVDFVPGPNHVNIVFDEELTSPDEIASILRNAGHSISAEKRAKETASCCGGCCS